MICSYTTGERGWTRTERRTRTQGAREELGRKSAEGTLRDWKCRTDEEESKRCGRGRRSRPLARLYANRNPWLSRETGTGRGRGEGRKVLKQGKECPRQWRGRPRPPHHTNPALPEKGRIYLLLPRRCRFLFLPFLRKGNGGAKRSFITQAAAAAARPTGLFSSFFVLPPLSAQRSSGERAAS